MPVDSPPPPHGLARDHAKEVLPIYHAHGGAQRNPVDMVPLIENLSVHDLSQPTCRISWSPETKTLVFVDAIRCGYSAKMLPSAYALAKLIHRFSAQWGIHYEQKKHIFPVVINKFLSLIVDNFNGPSAGGLIDEVCTGKLGRANIYTIRFARCLPSMTAAPNFNFYQLRDQAFVRGYQSKYGGEMVVKAQNHINPSKKVFIADVYRHLLKLEEPSQSPPHPGPRFMPTEAALKLAGRDFATTAPAADDKENVAARHHQMPPGAYPSLIKENERLGQELGQLRVLVLQLRRAARQRSSFLRYCSAFADALDILEHVRASEGAVRDVVNTLFPFGDTFNPTIQYETWEGNSDNFRLDEKVQAALYTHTFMGKWPVLDAARPSYSFN